MVFLVCVFFAALQMEYERAFRISLERTAPQKYFPGARRFLLEPENCCSPGTLCSESDLLPFRTLKARAPKFMSANAADFRLSPAFRAKTAEFNLSRVFVA